jgi:glycosyltransferase involved in cell wall biosynthesis
LKEKALAAIQAHTSEDLSVGRAQLPVVSVIITNYNYGKYIRECIESCLEQDYPFCDIVIIDDCSVDDSLDIIKPYEDRVKIVRHEHNKGQLAAFYSGLEVSKGEFTVFVDADDFLDADAVSAHLFIHLFTKPPVGFTCLRNREVSAGSKILSNFNMDFQNNGREIAYVSPRVIHTPTWSWSTTSSMMFRTELLNLIKPEDTSAFRICADYYLAHFANLLGGSILYNKAKVNYRRHGENGYTKNFVIGGHRPTGVVNTIHEDIQKLIISNLLERRELFQRYFHTPEKFFETVLFTAPKEFIEEHFEISADILKYIENAEPEVLKIRDMQIETKKTALELFKKDKAESEIQRIRENMLNIYNK